MDLSQGKEEFFDPKAIQQCSGQPYKQISSLAQAWNGIQ